MWILASLLLHLSSVSGSLTSRTPILEHFVYTDEDRATWEAARVFCRRNHTDLATIESAALNKALLQEGGWIGLHKETPRGPWKWARENTAATFFSWADGEPKHGEHCTLKYFDAESWKSVACEKKHSFLCSDEKLFLVKENKTWEEALDHCRSLSSVEAKGPSSHPANLRHDLATLISQSYIAYAKEKVQEATTDEVWTGLCFLAGQWLWVGGEEVQYRDIPSCPGLRSCGVLGKSGNVDYQIRDCRERRNFLCYRRDLNQ